MGRGRCGSRQALASVSLWFSWAVRQSCIRISAATAQPKAIVVLSSLHHLDYAEAGCSHLRVVADMKGITEVLNNASDFDPKDVKFNKQGYDKFNGNFKAVTMLAEEQNNYCQS